MSSIVYADAVRIALQSYTQTLTYTRESGGACEKAALRVDKHVTYMIKGEMA